MCMWGYRLSRPSRVQRARCSELLYAISSWHTQGLIMIFLLQPLGIPTSPVRLARLYRLEGSRPGTVGCSLGSTAICYLIQQMMAVMAVMAGLTASLQQSTIHPQQQRQAAQKLLIIGCMQLHTSLQHCCHQELGGHMHPFYEPSTLPSAHCWWLQLPPAC